MTEKSRLITTAFISGVVAATLVFALVGRMRSPADALDSIRLVPSASAAPADAVDSGSGHEEAFRRLNYYPNTEELDPNEMRVIALGTGTPNFRRSQASGCWLVELGDGKKFFYWSVVYTYMGE